MNRIALLAVAATLSLPAAAIAQNSGAAGGAAERPAMNSEINDRMPPGQNAGDDQSAQENDRSLNVAPADPEQIGALPPGTDAEHGSGEDQAQPDQNAKGQMME